MHVLDRYVLYIGVSLLAAIAWQVTEIRDTQEKVVGASEYISCSPMGDCFNPDAPVACAYDDDQC